MGCPVHGGIEIQIVGQRAGSHTPPTHAAHHNVAAGRAGIPVELKVCLRLFESVSESVRGRSKKKSRHVVPPTFTTTLCFEGVTQTFSCFSIEVRTPKARSKATY